MFYQSILKLSLSAALPLSLWAQDGALKQVHVQNITRAQVRIVGGQLTTKFDPTLAKNEIIVQYQENAQKACVLTSENFGSEYRLRIENTSWLGSWFASDCANTVSLMTGGLDSLELNSVSGGIEVQDKIGAVRATTVNGRIVNFSENAELLKSINGSIESSSDFPPKEVRTINGKVQIRVKGESFPADRDAIQLETVNGVIQLRLAAKVRARVVNASAKHSVQIQRSGQPSGAELRVDAETVNGQISIRDLE